jgi:replicative DNA helicase
MTSSALPEAAAAERAVIGAAMQDGSTADAVLETLRPDQLVLPANQIILSLIADLREAAKPIDLIILTTELEKRGQLQEVGDADYLTELVTDFGCIANWKHYAAEVLDIWKRRQMRSAALQMAEAAHDRALRTEDAQERCEQILYALRIHAERENPVAHCRDATAAAIEHIESVYRSRGATIGLASGIHDLDRSTGGFLGGQMIIIAARPACGKSALGMQMALHAVQVLSVPTLVFSVEMPARELMVRAICSQASVDLQRLRDGFFHKNDLGHISKVASDLIKAKLYLDETPGLTVAQFRARARRAKAAHGLGLIVVDYLQFMHGSSKRAGESRALEVSEISKAIKTTAKELDIPIIALAQLNRDADSEHLKPKLSNLRESGSIEQDADTVLLIHRLDKNKKKSDDDEPMDHNTLLIVAKQRNGPTPEIKLNFIGNHTRFENLTQKQYSNNQNERQK